MTCHTNTITEAQIRTNSSPQSYAKGEEYCRDGAVSGLSLSGSVLTGIVEDGRLGPFEVTVNFNAEDAIIADCDCPYRFGNWCTHIVAVLLRYLTEPSEIESVSPLGSVLSTLDRDSLQRLLLTIAENHPELMVELQLELTRSEFRFATLTPDTYPQNAPLPYFISISEVRERVRSAVSSASHMGNQRNYFDHDGYAVSELLTEAIDPLSEMAVLSLEGGDGERALSILEAITDELISGWISVVDHVYESADLFIGMGDIWAEALLVTELSAEVRREWTFKIDGWRGAEQRCAADIGLAHASRAASEGWDYSPLLRKFNGDLLAVGSPIVAPDKSNERLTNIRLKILEKQGRLEDAAKLARADGVHEKYMDLLVTLGFAVEAVDYAEIAICSSQASLGLARKLHSKAEPKLALKVAEQGLHYKDGVYPLAVWTRDAAHAEGTRDLAIRAGILAIKADSTLNDYTYLQSISEDLWPSIREEILNYIRGLDHGVDSEQVDILFHEGLLLDALDGVRKSYDYRLVERVVEACLPLYPAEVIPICKAQAESVLSAKKADRYHHAIKWLSLARDAYSGAHRSAEWIAYKNELMLDHSRKYRFIPDLRAL